jgi:hypothetical protein
MIQTGKAKSSVAHHPTLRVEKAMSQASGARATQFAKNVGRSPKTTEVKD